MDLRGRRNWDLGWFTFNEVRFQAYQLEVETIFHDGQLWKKTALISTIILSRQST